MFKMRFSPAHLFIVSWVRGALTSYLQVFVFLCVYNERSKWKTNPPTWGVASQSLSPQKRMTGAVTVVKLYLEGMNEMRKQKYWSTNQNGFALTPEVLAGRIRSGWSWRPSPSSGIAHLNHKDWHKSFIFLIFCAFLYLLLDRYSCM